MDDEEQHVQRPVEQQREFLLLMRLSGWFRQYAELELHHYFVELPKALRRILVDSSTLPWSFWLWPCGVYRHIGRICTLGCELDIRSMGLRYTMKGQKRQKLDTGVFFSGIKSMEGGCDAAGEGRSG